jgi:hypothetical protein
MSLDACFRNPGKTRAFPRALGIAVVLVSAMLLSRGDSTNAPPAASPVNATPGAVVNPPGKPAVPPVPEDYFQRYGKILSPGGEPAHPLKLAMPLPDVGQVKVPSQDELNMREKLEGLATLSDDDIRTNLDEWPAFKKMSLTDEGTMLMRIQQFKEHRWRVAQDKAHALGLLTLRPDQMARFEKEYWDKRLKLDRDLAKQFEPVLKAREAKISEELFREFSLPSKSVPTPPAPVLAAKPTPAPVPPPPAVAQNAKAAAEPAPPPSAPPSMR